MPAGSAPLPLAYDDLPPGSDIRRERDVAGGAGGASVRIVVPAGAPSRRVRRRTLTDALARGAVESVPLLIIAIAVFAVGLYRQRVSGRLLMLAYGFFAIFCAALVALVVWVRFGEMSDALRAGRRQMTILVATPARLLVETSGPFGTAGYDFPADVVIDVQIAHGPLIDDLGLRRRVNHLTLQLKDGRTIRLLPGRDRAE